MKSISFRIDDRQFKKTFDKIDKDIRQKAQLFVERLAMIGIKEASLRFTTAIYDGNNDVQVSLEPIENGYKIVASGKAVCFIEFGTGVYHNPTEPYPEPRPSGVVGIGEYGKGYGKRRGWKYTDESGSKVFTRGNPAQMPMWYAKEEMSKNISKIAKEIFG